MIDEERLDKALSKFSPTDLEKMKQDLESQLSDLKSKLGIDMKDTAGVNPAASIDLIYTASQGRILTVAQKLMRNIMTQDISDLECPEEIAIPVLEKWDFKIGDRVKVKYSLSKFRFIQKRSLGWSKKMANAVKVTGIVFRVFNEYDCHILVFFPTLHKKFNIHAGVLEKAQSGAEVYSTCQFDLGDVVAIRASLEATILLQKGLGNIPTQFRDKIGKVVYAGKHYTFVTFDGEGAVAVNPALLRKEKKKIDFPISKTGEGFKPGEKVNAITNLKKLISQQEGFGNWNPRMSSLIGQELTVSMPVAHVIRILEKNGRVWHINPKSISLATGKIAADKDEDVPIKVAEKVQVKLSMSRNLLRKKGIPTIFMEYLESTSVLTTYDDNLQPGVLFDSEQIITVHPSILEKASTREAERANQIESDVKGLKRGDEVYLDVGPKNYVLNVLRKARISEDVTKAMTSKAVLLGFLGPQHVQIKYPNGAMYKINKKYLTVPGKFIRDEDEMTVEFGLHAAIELNDIVSQCLSDIHKSETGKEFEVSLSSMSKGSPPVLQFGIKSAVATHALIVNELQKTGLEVDKICDGVVMIGGVKEYPGKIRVEFFLNDENDLLISDHDIPVTSTSGTDVINEPVQQVVQAPEAKDKAEPEEQDMEGQAPAFIGGAVPAFGGFQWMKLSDQALQRDVFFPFLVRNRGEQVAEPAQGIQNQNQYSNQVVNVSGGSTIGSLIVNQ